jgi:hypothetical protein
MSQDTIRYMLDDEEVYSIDWWIQRGKAPIYVMGGAAPRRLAMGIAGNIRTAQVLKKNKYMRAEVYDTDNIDMRITSSDIEILGPAEVDDFGMYRYTFVASSVSYQTRSHDE